MVVHHLGQAKAVLALAAELGLQVQLKSAPDAAAYAGVDYLKALGEAAGQELMIDCGDDPGLVLAALRAGCRKLAAAPPPASAEKLASIAVKHDATLRFETESRAPCLALAPDEPSERLRSRLQAMARSGTRG